MEKRIYKYQPPTSATVHLLLPGRYPQIIHVGQQDGMITFWAEVEPDSTEHTRISLRVVGTGHAVPELGFTHLATVMLGEFVWHVYWMLHPQQAGAPSPSEGTQPARSGKTN